MKSIALILTLIASALPAAQQAKSSAEQQLQAAIHREDVEGDLRGAIELYKAISAQPGDDRALAATALLRMGECQEKLGQSTVARTTYVHLIRQFRDQQKIAEQARGRLEELSPRKQNKGTGFGVGTAAFPVDVAAGKHVRYSGYIKTEAVTDGWAGLWWRVDGEPGTGMLAFDNMQDRGATGTTPWTHYVIEMDVPANARNINFGVLHSGNGTAWFDTLQVEVNGVPYTDTAKFDLDFESNWPRGFYTGGQGYKVQLDREVAYTGKQSLRSRSLGAITGEAYGSPNFGRATASFPVNAAAGKHVKYSGYIKTEGIVDGWAGLWWRVDGEAGAAPLAFDNMYDRGATGTTPWTLYQIELEVPQTARNIIFGVLHSGSGKAWFDSLQIELDGVAYADTSDFDLDFESGSPAPRGFNTGGKGYHLALDKEVAHSGKQSLRSECVSLGKQTGGNGR